MEIKITIILNAQTGQMSVNGPPDKVLSLGMLEMAKSLILSQQPQPRPNIVVPQVVKPS